MKRTIYQGNVENLEKMLNGLNSERLFVISKITKSMIDIKLKEEQMLFKNVPNHFGFFRYSKNQLDVTTFTTIKKKFPNNFSVFPFKQELCSPELRINQGTQGLGGISMKLSLNEELMNLFISSKNNFNTTNFCGIDNKEGVNIFTFIENHNVIIGKEDLNNLSNIQKDYFYELILLKHPLPCVVNRTNWCIFEQKYTLQEKLKLLQKNQIYYLENPNPALKKLVALQKTIMNFFYSDSFQNIQQEPFKQCFDSNCHKGIVSRSFQIYDD